MLGKPIEEISGGASGENPWKTLANILIGMPGTTLRNSRRNIGNFQKETLEANPEKPLDGIL